MNARKILRRISLVMFIGAIVFLCFALGVPTLGSVFYIGKFKVDAEVKQLFYIIYALTMIGLFFVSFFIPKKRKGAEE